LLPNQFRTTNKITTNVVTLTVLSSRSVQRVKQPEQTWTVIFKRLGLDNDDFVLSHDHKSDQAVADDHLKIESCRRLKKVSLNCSKQTVPLYKVYFALILQRV